MSDQIAIIEEIRNVICPINGKFQKVIVICPYCHERHSHGYTPDNIHKVAHCLKGSYIVLPYEKIKLNIPNGK